MVFEGLTSMTTLSPIGVITVMRMLLGLEVELSMLVAVIVVSELVDVVLLVVVDVVVLVLLVVVVVVVVVVALVVVVVVLLRGSHQHDFTNPGSGSPKTVSLHKMDPVATCVAYLSRAFTLSRVWIGLVLSPPRYFLP